jgi:hypothetical protein
MVVVDGQGVPLGSRLVSASPGEVTLAESTLAQISVPRGGRGRPQKRPLRVVADRAYDSDPLRERLLKRGMLLIKQLLLARPNFRTDRRGTLVSEQSERGFGATQARAAPAETLRPIRKTH